MNISRTRTASRIAALLVTASALTLTHGAFAQSQDQAAPVDSAAGGDVQEIVVTATRRSEKLQTVAAGGPPRSAATSSKSSTLKALAT